MLFFFLSLGHCDKQSLLVLDMLHIEQHPCLRVSLDLPICYTIVHILARVFQYIKSPSYWHFLVTMVETSEP